MNDQFIIDDITWHDLDLEEVYNRVNCASSSVGQEYLKKTLKTPEFDKRVLEKRDAKADCLKKNNTLTGNYKKIFKGLGKTKKVSFLDHIFKIRKIKTKTI